MRSNESFIAILHLTTPETMRKTLALQTKKTKNNLLHHIVKLTLMLKRERDQRDPQELIYLEKNLPELAKYFEKNQLDAELEIAGKVKFSRRKFESKVRKLLLIVY